MEYGCATTNKFSFLDDNEVEDPSVLLAQVNLSAAAKTAEDKKAGVAAAKAAAAEEAKQKGMRPVRLGGDKAKAGGKDGKPRPLQQQTDNRGQNRQNQFGNSDDKKSLQNRDRRPREDKENTSKRGGANNFGGDRPQGGDRPPRRFNNDGTDAPRRPRPPRPQQGGEGAEGAVEGGEGGFRRNNTSQGGFRGGRGGGGSRRGDGNGGAGGRPRRTTGEGETREFDRHSRNDKTGIKAVDKKDGAGRGNWGTATDEGNNEDQNLDKSQNEQHHQQQQQQNNTDNTQAGGEDQANWADRVDKNEEQTESDENKEAQVNFMTLDEYKVLKNEINKKNLQFNVRAPGEGEDPKRWANTTLMPKKPVIKESEEEYEEDEDEEEDEEEEKRKKVLESIQIKFYESGRQNNDDRRGDRGDDRRGPRPDGPRGPRPDGERRGPRRDNQDGERRGPRRDNHGSESDKTAAPNTTEGGDQAPADQEQAPRRDQQPRRDNNGQRGGGRGGASGSRGGRGGGRGGQQGAYRGPKANMPRIEDEQDFPSLGK